MPAIKPVSSGRIEAARIPGDVALLRREPRLSGPLSQGASRTPSARVDGASAGE